MLTPINVNDYVVVQLTAEGEEHLREHFESLARQLPARMPEVNAEAFMQASVYDGGRRRLQMHELMYIFGPAMYVGAPQMFVENKLHIA